jgi:ABC-2 type transport system permease protein
MSGYSAFELVGERGWRRGFGNLLENELARWWKTRMWWIQCLIWGGLTVFMVGQALFSKSMYKIPNAWRNYVDLAGLFQTVGLIVIMQGFLVGEKRDGTAAWVLSKPAARPAFLLSKFVANSLGVLATMVVLCGAVTYILFRITIKYTPDLSQMLAGMGVIFLNHLFYLTLMVMLAAFFNDRRPVIAIPAAIILLSHNLIRLLPVMGILLPWTLTIQQGSRAPMLAAALAGWPIDSYIPQIVALAVECILFLLIGLWRFNREEL